MKPLAAVATLVIALALSLVLLGCDALMGGAKAVLEPTIQAIEVSEPMVLSCSEERQMACPEGEAGAQCIEAERAALDVIARAYEAVRIAWCAVSKGDSRCLGQN